MLKVLVPLAAVIGLAACGGQRVEVTKSIEDQAKLEILRSVRAPDSIAFSGRFVGSHNINHTIVCGWVNGANGFGGHTGWTMVAVVFFDNPRPSEIISEGDRAEIQCALANAKPVRPNVSDALLKKHGIGAQETEKMAQ